MNDVKADSDLKDDLDGEATLRLIKNCNRVVNRLSGVHPSSLGLHPAVYFYSQSGKYQTTSFLAIVGIVKDLEKRDKFKEFTAVRERFEHFLVRHKVLSTQVVWRSGSGTKGAGRMQALYQAVLDGLWAGDTDEEILDNLLKNPIFSYLQPREMEDPSAVPADFTTETKSAAFLREALAQPMKCRICRGLIHANSISVDHVTRKREGGRGSVENAQLVHPFCNSGVKN